MQVVLRGRLVVQERAFSFIEQELQCASSSKVSGTRAAESQGDVHYTLRGFPIPLFPPPQKWVTTECHCHHT